MDHKFGIPTGGAEAGATLAASQPAQLPTTLFLFHPGEAQAPTLTPHRHSTHTQAQTMPWDLLQPFPLTLSEN